jgi:hypothetical protein
MKISLIALCNYSFAAELDPKTGEAHIIHRTSHRSDDGTKHVWLPKVAENGWFQRVRGLWVAVYRDPEAPAALWLQLGERRFELGKGSSSQFEPEISNEDPSAEDIEAERTFRLFRNGSLQAMHQYRFDEIEYQAPVSIDPFPAWPREEEEYDLLFFVHRILASDRWSRVLLRSVKR